MSCMFDDWKINKCLNINSFMITKTVFFNARNKTELGLAGHPGPVGLCTCIILEGQGFKSRRRRVQSIQFCKARRRWKVKAIFYSKHLSHVGPSNIN